MDKKENRIILKKVRDYYEKKLSKFGHTPKGVDWNSEESQEIRFEQLTKVIDPKIKFFSIIDYGCGYGAFYKYLSSHFNQFAYTGHDLSTKMTDTGKKLFLNPRIKWINDVSNLKSSDYLIASGIFNVKLDSEDSRWLQYIFDTISKFDRLAIKGFAFNVLTKYSDQEFMKRKLYYADPSLLFDFCKTNCSKYVSIIHDYPLFEFTILVRKQAV
jgi:SAM-dependent methyltransferase